MAVFNNVSALARTTVRRQAWNQWMNKSVLYWKLTRDGRVKPKTEPLENGKVRFPLVKAKNSSQVWIDRGGSIEASNEQVLEGAEFDFAFSAITVYLDAIDMARTKGAGANLKEILTKNTIESAQDNMGTEVYNDGSDTSKPIGLTGMMTLATYGGLTTTEVADWAAKSYSGGTTVTYPVLDRLQTDVSNFEMPDMGLTTPEVGSRIRALFQSQERYEVNKEMRDIGFNNIMLNGETPIYLDPKCTGAGSWTGSHSVFFLNTKYLEFIWHPDWKMVPDEPRIPEGKLARIIPYLIGCLLGTNCRKAHGYWTTANPSAA